MFEGRPSHRRPSLLTGLAAVLVTALAIPPSAEAVRYVSFGDSITVGTGDPAKVPGYTPRLESLLRAKGLNDRVLNYGSGGETTTGGLTRLDDVLGAISFQVLLLMEGTNDISRGISMETTLFNLDQMAKKAKAANRETVHTTVIPRFPEAKVDRENITNKRMNEAIRDLAGTRGRRLVDVFEVFRTTANLFLGRYAVLEGDPVGHPNPSGYDLLAETFLSVLSDEDDVPPVVGLMSPENQAEGVSAATSIELDLWDFGAGTNAAATALSVNGVPVTAQKSSSGRRQSLSYTPPTPLSGVVSVTVTARDKADPVNFMSRQTSTFAIEGTTFLEGDIDRSGRVDGLDLSILAFAFGSTRGQARFNPKADLNGDGLVGGTDLAILASNFALSS